MNKENCTYLTLDLCNSIKTNINTILFFYVFLFAVCTAKAQKIKALSNIDFEANEESQVMEFASMLTDIHSPRLAGTENYLNAAKWIQEQLNEYGVNNIILDPIDKKIRGWKLNHFSIEQIAPNYRRISGFPIAWTSSINQNVNSKLILIENIKSLDNFQNKYKGRVKDKIVLLKAPGDYSFLNRTVAERYSIEQLDEITKHKEVKPTLSYKFMKNYLSSVEDSIKHFYSILKKERTKALFVQSNRTLGVLKVEGVPFYNKDDELPVSSFVIANEDFGRLKRILQKNKEVRLKISQRSSTSYSADRNVNVLATIEGTDDLLKKEIIIIGAHLDT